MVKSEGYPAIFWCLKGGMFMYGHPHNFPPNSAFVIMLLYIYFMILKVGSPSTLGMIGFGRLSSTDSTE